MSPTTAVLNAALAASIFPWLPIPVPRQWKSAIQARAKPIVGTDFSENSAIFLPNRAVSVDVESR